MSVLVLGASGRLGTEIKAALDARNVLSVTPSHDQADVTNSRVIQNMVRLTRPLGESLTTVINLTAYHDTKGCEQDSALAFHMNAEIPHRLARSCASHRLKFVHVSTDYVFGGIPPTFEDGYGVDSPPAPVNVYGASKLAGETLVLAATMDSLVVRVSSLFGSPPGVGDFVKLVRDRVAADEPMTVVDDVTMSPTYTRDVATVLVNNVLPHDPRGIVHLNNSGCPVTWYEFARHIATILGAPTEFITPTTLSETSDVVPRPRTSAMRGHEAWALPDWRASVKSYLQRLDSDDVV